MSDEELTARKKLGQDLRYWKKFAFSGFATGVLNLDAAIQSLSTPDPFIYARQDYASRWLICKVGSQFKAMFHTAGVWSGSSHLDTGNYVPEGQVPPTQIAEGRIQRNASNRCQVDYTIDTRYDKALFSHQAKLEDLVTKNKEFNKSCKPRRNWQKGDKFDGSFTFSAQVFVRPYGYDVNKLKNPPYVLHPWVHAVVQPKTGTPEYYANPHRPELWDCTTGTMVCIDKADPPFLQKGDLVWMSFYVEFIIGQNTWSTPLTPKHIIRVGVMPSILMTPADNGDEVAEQEPDYTIKEGATFVMNVDFPMYDEVNDKIGSISGPAPAKAVDSGNQAKCEAVSEVSDGTSAEIKPGEKTRSDAVTPPQVIKADPEVESTDRNLDGSDGSLTPVPSSPRSTTPERWSVSPVSKKPEAGGKSVDSKNARGIKRGHGDTTDGEVVHAAKKGRQTGTRRPRNA